MARTRNAENVETHGVRSSDAPSSLAPHVAFSLNVCRLRITLVVGIMLILSAPHARAQVPVRDVATQPLGDIRGRLVDSVSLRPVTGGSVTAIRASDSAFAGGGLPRADVRGRRPAAGAVYPSRSSARLRAEDPRGPHGVTDYA